MPGVPTKWKDMSHVRAVQAVYKTAGPSLDSPVPSETVPTGMGRYEPMPVEKVLTSGGDTSVGEVQTYPVEVRPKVTLQEDVINKAECRALQIRQDELRCSVEKQQEEIKAQARRVRNDESVQVRKGQRTFTPAWQPQCERTLRSVSPNKKKQESRLKWSGW